MIDSGLSASLLAAIEWRTNAIVNLGVGAFAGLVAMGVGAIYLRQKLKQSRRETEQAREYAEHCVQERNLAQEELVRRLESERELVKEKLQFESQLNAFEKYASLAQLSLGAAHEINNPLLGILSHLELELKEADAEQRKEIEECIEGARRITSAVRGLLDYARTGPLKLSQVNLARLVGDAMKFIEHQPLFRQLQLQNWVPPDVPSITADANQVSQILMNLLLNAAQATPPGGTITVMARRVRLTDMVELLVRDTGCGIDADILPHIFEPFFTTKRGKGTGLGLSITQNYVVRHGGNIDVESIPGQGTAVKVILPIRQASPVVVGEEVIA
jgi:signal transduction histidine kinase